MGMFKNEFHEIVRGAVKKYSKEFNCNESQVQIMLYLDEKAADAYAVYLNNQFAQKATVLELLCRKIDFTGISLVIAGYAKKLLHQYAKEFSIELNKVRIMIVTDGNSKILLYLLNGADAVRLLNADAVLSDESYSEVSNDIFKQIEQ